jgi:rubredoxin
MRPQLISTITCPNCGLEKEEEMPTTACQFFYECDNCKKVLKPKKGIVVSFVPTVLSLVHLFRITKIVAD